MSSKIIEKKIKIVTSNYVLNLLPGEEMPDFAIAMLEENIENEELIELAGLNKPTLLDARKLFLKAIDKLEIKLPDVREATIFLAKEIAEKITTGTISPYEGARKIWWDLANIEGAYKGLEIFVGLASEYEDSHNKELKKDYENQIIEEAMVLIGHD